MIALLIDQPLLLLFGVLAAGYAFGRVRVAGVSLGVAAVLFVGLGAGALDARLQLPEIVQRFGLVLFVYTVGIASGAGFFASFRRRGLRDALFTLGIVAMVAALVVLAGRVLGFGQGRTAGLFAGCLTNTPALAAVIERMRAATHGDPVAAAEPVVAYSLAYPMGVLGLILVMAVARRRWRAELRGASSGPTLDVRTVRVTQAAACRESIEAMAHSRRWRVRFVRRRRGDDVRVMRREEPLALGDLVTIVGTREELERIVPEVGEVSDEHIELDRTDLDFRRIFVSDPRVVGRTLADLHLLDRFGALVTRVRRGDHDLLPDGQMTLELGDRVRVVAPREKLGEVARVFGDSYRALAEVDAVTFALGVSAGLALGLVTVPLPGGGSFQLGVAGGPLIAGLIFGALGRTGPVVWQLPFSANLTLRQLGLALFLAGVGTRSGGVFAAQLAAPGALPLFVTGAVLTALSATIALVVGRTLLKIRPGVLLGMVSALHTQPAALAFAAESAGDEEPNAGYAAIFPFATIAKILIAQVIAGVAR